MVEDKIPNIFITSYWVRKGCRKVRIDELCFLNPSSNEIIPLGEVDDDFGLNMDARALRYSKSNVPPYIGYRISVRGDSMETPNSIIISAEEWNLSPTSPKAYRMVAEEAARFMGTHDFTILIS